jgi:hypothetical protein
VSFFVRFFQLLPAVRDGTLQVIWRKGEYNPLDTSLKNLPVKQHQLLVPFITTVITLVATPMLFINYLIQTPAAVFN